MNPKKRITVLLADDHKVIRKELRKMLEVESDLEVVGEAANGKQAVEMAWKLRPAVIVMDISMPKLNGLDATQQILQVLPATRVLILSSHSGEAYVESAMAIGAAGYIDKLTSISVLGVAIRTVQHQTGAVFLCPTIAKIFKKQSVSMPQAK